MIDAGFTVNVAEAVCVPSDAVTVLAPDVVVGEIVNEPEIAPVPSAVIVVSVDAPIFTVTEDDAAKPEPVTDTEVLM